MFRARWKLFQAGEDPKPTASQTHPPGDRNSTPNRFSWMLVLTEGGGTPPTTRAATSAQPPSVARISLRRRKIVPRRRGVFVL